MKKWMSVILVMVMTVVCSMTMVQTAFAAELPRISVPVKVSLSGTLPNSAENFTVKLKANNGDFPMPDGSENGIYTMTITGEGTQNIPTITYSKVGVYTYTIYQVARTNKKCIYDDTVYTLMVYITNAEDGSGLEATTVLYKDSQGDKLSVAEFENEYEVVKPTTSLDTPKTGDESTSLLYVVLTVVSLGVIGNLFLTHKSKKTEE